MEQLKPLYIFDLDGTLALIDHRRHILDRDDPNKWRDFYAACDKDEPNYKVIEVMEALYFYGTEIWIFTGRSDEVREKTIHWLSEHTCLMTGELVGTSILTMRKLGDHTRDDVLKRKWLHNMSYQDRARLSGVFEDRDRVVQMWREEGVTCFQVANGNY